MAAAPLLEQALGEKNETIVRPNYDQTPAPAESDDLEETDDAPVAKADDDDEEEE